MEAEIKTDLEEIKATESETVAVQQEVRHEEAAVETIGALKGRSGTSNWPWKREPTEKADQRRRCTKNP
jgi:hypothetical protein